MTKAILIIFGLIIAGLLIYFVSKPKSNVADVKTSQEVNNAGQTDFPLKPKWKPDVPVDVDAIYKAVKYYTGGKMQFAIFQNGTVAFFTKKIDNIEDSSVATLSRIYNAHPDFKPMVMDDDNYLVQYSEPAFTIVFRDEIKNNWDYIEKNHLEGLCNGEVLINAKGEQNVFDSVGKICLYGRAKMFMDAQAPRIVKIFNPAVASLRSK